MVFELQSLLANCCTICMWQNVVVHQQGALVEVVPCVFYKLKVGCRWQHASAFAWCWLRWSCVACSATACAAGCKRTYFLWHYPHVCVRHNWFCLVFSKKFNTISVLSVHQSLTLSQKIDSRGGLFWCKKRLVVHAVKVNIYLKTSPLTPVFGLFAAKRSAFWC